MNGTNLTRPSPKPGLIWNICNHMVTGVWAVTKYLCTQDGCVTEMLYLHLKFSEKRKLKLT